MKSYQLIVLFITISSCVIIVNSLKVRNCKAGAQAKVDNNQLSKSITVSNCTKPPCKFVRNTKVNVEMKFKPSEDVKNLKNEVYAIIAGIPFPFIGVDGQSVCSKVYMADGQTKAECPLKADTDYIYRDSFDILAIYPRIVVQVHWALKNEKKDELCFEVKARIV